MATILSAQSTDKMINTLTPAVFAKYPNATALAAADPAELEPMIFKSGFFRAKAKSIIGMAKKVVAEVKLQIPAGAANPSPPVGPALGQRGVNIMEFCKQFNAQTQAQQGLIIPVIITVYADRSYTFITKTPPVAILIKRAVGIAKGSGEPNKNKVGKITSKQVEEIAKLKLPDLNCETLDAAVQTVRGTARSMGVEVA